MTVPYMILYAGEVCVILTLLFTFYWGFLRNSTFYNIHRFILILIVIISFVLPVISRFTYQGEFEQLGGSIARYFSAPTLTGDNRAGQMVSVKKTNDMPVVSIWAVVGIIYFSGLFFFLSRVFFHINAVMRIVRKAKRKHFFDYSIAYTHASTPPFSFFRIIILNPEIFRTDDHDYIIAHEKIHIEQRHTLDILFMDMFSCILWFHPVAWKLKEIAVLNLEYIADREILRTGIEPKRYQYALLNVGFSNASTKSVNYFNQSHLKKRIAMMNADNSSNHALWKYLFFIPLLVSLVAILGPINAQIAEKAKPTNMDIYLVIRQDISADQLKNITSYLREEGIEILFSDITYNPDHLLTGISMEIMKGGQSMGEIAASNKGRPIVEPLVFYLLRTRQGESALLHGLPKNLPPKDMNILQTLNGLLKYNPGTKEFDLHGSAVLNND